MHKFQLYLFDFDGTLSGRDSNSEFFKYCFRHSIRPWFFLPVVMIAVISRFFGVNAVWWRQRLRYFITPKMVQDFSKNFIKLHKQNRFGWAKELVAKEHARGNKVILISAGPDYLIPELVSDMKFDAILTSQMDYEKPWKYKFLCWGSNKVIALDKWAQQNKIIPNVIRAYSDSKSDLPIMNIAKERVWIDRKTGERISKF